MRIECGEQFAENKERMAGMFASQIGKASGHYRFQLQELLFADSLPFMSASSLNNIRRTLAEELDRQSCIRKDILHREPGRNCERERLAAKNVSYKQNVSNNLSAQIYTEAGAVVSEQAYELTHRPDAELMRTRYCIKYELGVCPVHQKAFAPNLPKPLQSIKAGTPLFLLNNGRRLALHFDCRNCEMTVKEVQSNTL
jgi:putative protease